MADKSAAPGTGEGSGEDRLSPQLNPAAVDGPDTAKMPPNPLHGNGQPTGSFEHPDWEARFKGLNKKYQEDRTEWEERFEEKDETIGSLSKRLEALESRLPAPEPEPTAKPQARKSAPKDDVDTDDASQAIDRMMSRVMQLEADRFKTATVVKMMQAGQPGHGLPLLEWLDEIPLRLDDEGMPDQEAQEKAVLSVVEKLKSLTGDASKRAQQAMTAGYTPGSSPGSPPAPTSAKEEIDEYHKLMEERSDPSFDDLPEREQRAKDQRFYQLVNKYGPDLPGVSLPWMDMNEVMKHVQGTRDMVNELKGLVGQS